MKVEKTQLEEIREHLNLTQVEFIVDSTLTVEQLDNIERRRFIPDKNYIDEIEKILNFFLINKKKLKLIKSDLLQLDTPQHKLRSASEDINLALAVRLHLNKTQDSFAKLMKVSRMTVFNWENNKFTPTPKHRRILIDIIKRNSLKVDDNLTK